MKTYYEVLGVASNATHQEIQEAYVRKCQELSFTAHKSVEEYREKRKLIDEAHLTLSHYSERQLYDKYQRANAATAMLGEAPSLVSQLGAKALNWDLNTESGILRAVKEFSEVVSRTMPPSKESVEPLPTMIQRLADNFDQLKKNPENLEVFFKFAMDREEAFSDYAQQQNMPQMMEIVHAIQRLYATEVMKFHLSEARIGQNLLELKTACQRAYWAPPHPGLLPGSQDMYAEYHHMADRMLAVHSKLEQAAKGNPAELSEVISKNRAELDSLKREMETKPCFQARDLGPFSNGQRMLEALQQIHQQKAEALRAPAARASTASPVNVDITQSMPLPPRMRR
ncbi:MAG: DnaJ domain-containing protein [Gammaproteobacteria bacterium]|nr:DnaJ domain-containing protein [Gammaproteobacteria bacterium]